jgi:hypothetical protein
MVKGVNNPPPRHPSLTGLDTTKRTGTTAKPDTTPKSPGNPSSPTRTSTDGLQASTGQKASTMSTFRASIGSLRNQVSNKLSDAQAAVTSTLSDAKASVMSINVGESLSNASTRVKEAVDHLQTQLHQNIETAKATAGTVLGHASDLHGAAEKTLGLANSLMSLSESASKNLGPIAQKYPQATFLAAFKTCLDTMNTFKPALQTAGLQAENAGAVLDHLKATFVPSKPSAPPPGEKTAEAVA